MTTSTKGFKIGFRYLSFFKLNASQTPLGTSPTVGYEGEHYESARALTINNAQPRIIPQPGDDRVEALQALPANTAMDADLHVGMSNLDILAILCGVKVNTLATTKTIAMQTNKLGLEPYVGVLAYSHSNDWPLGNQTWDWYFFPYTKAIWLASGNAETPQDEIFKLAPNYTSLNPWGEALSEATHGAISQQAIKGKSIGRPHLISFLADGTATEFLFNTDHPAYSAAAVACFVNGVTAPGVALTTKFTPTTKPSNLDRVDIWYEE